MSTKPSTVRQNHPQIKAPPSQSSCIIIIITRPRSIAIDARATAPIAVARPHTKIRTAKKKNLFEARSEKFLFPDSTRRGEHLCGTTLGTIDVAKVMGAY